MAAHSHRSKVQQVTWGAYPVAGQPFVCDLPQGAKQRDVRDIGRVFVHAHVKRKAYLRGAGTRAEMRDEAHRMIPQVLRRRAVVAEVRYDLS